MPTLIVGYKRRKIDGVIYYVDNFYFKRADAFERAKRLREKGYLAQVREEKKLKKGKIVYGVWKRHKKHPHLIGLLSV